MIIKNVRLGHATNSSSSHSIVIMKEANHGYRSQMIEDQEYGWNDFILTGEVNKLEYLAQITKGALLASGVDEEFIPLIIKDLLRVDVDMGGHIDHQSWCPVPGSHKSPKSPNTDFIKDFGEFMLRKEVVVFGGNDNCYEDTGEKYGKDIEKELEYNSGGWYLNGPGEIIAKKNGDWWTIYNRKTGAKMEFSFEAEPRAVQKPNAPDLIDFKITNYCPYGCEYCYMDSSTQGEHADYGVLYRIGAEMGEAGVFEVAIGGGEPTLHPNFWELLVQLKDQGVTPNFTTANYEWLKDHDSVGAVIDCCGSFAYSPRNIEDFEAFIKEYNYHMKARAGWNFKPVIHVVMGTVAAYTFKTYLELASKNNFGITLLGFKDVGRGLEYSMGRKYDGASGSYLEWLPKKLKEIQEGNDFHRIGIDTCLAKELEEVMKLPDMMYYTKEGFRSMYIDAVDNKYAASSYSGKTKDIPTHSHSFNHSIYDIEEMFSNIEEE